MLETDDREEELDLPEEGQEEDDFDETMWADPQFIEQLDVKGPPTGDETDNEIPTDETEVIVGSPRRPVWQRGELKLILVGGLSLFVFFAFYTFMRGGQTGIQEQMAADNNRLSPSSLPQTPVQGQGQPQDEAELAKLRAKLAVGEQAKEMSEVNKKEAKAPPPGTVVKPPATPAPPAIAAPPPTVYPTSYPESSAPYRYTPSDSSSTRSVPSVPTVAASAILPQTTVPPAIASVPPPPPVPKEARIASYGRLPGVPGQSSPVNASASVPSTVPSTGNGVVFANYPQGGGVPNTQPAPRSDLESQQASFLSGDLLTQLPPGATMQGKLITPAIAQPGNQFLVEITQPVGNIPAGSIASAQIEQMYPDGMMSASVGSIVTPGDDRFQIGKMQVMGTNGKPLRAKGVKRGPGVGEIIANITLGAISNATGALNRPQTRVDRRGVVYESYSGNTNFTASLLQGGVNTVLPMIQQQQAAIQSDLAGGQGNILFLQSGTDVKLQAF